MKFNHLLTLLVLSLLISCSSEEPSERTQNTNSESDTQINRSYSADDLRNAALEGNFMIIQEIAGSGVNIDEGDPLGRTAMMFASFNGHTDIVQFLIDEGAEVQKQNSEDRTSLMFASSGPFPETVELLLKNGADPNIKDNIEGWTALMYASAEGNMEVIEVLLEYDADISLQDTDGETAADFARNNGHNDVVSLLEN